MVTQISTKDMIETKQWPAPLKVVSWPVIFCRTHFYTFLFADQLQIILDYKHNWDDEQIWITQVLSLCDNIFLGCLSIYISLLR